MVGLLLLMQRASAGDLAQARAVSQPVLPFAFIVSGSILSALPLK